MEVYREQNTIFWRLRLEDAPKKEYRCHLRICNDINDQNINAVLSEINLQDMLELPTRAIFIPVKYTLLRA